MKLKEVMKRIFGVLAGAWIGNKLGLFIPLIGLLILLMLTDYFSGLLAAKKEALEHPNSKKYGLSSKKGIIGIYKKVGYIITIFITICIDYIIYKFADEMGLQYNSKTIFSLLVTCWFIINEIISILENTGRMGVELPKFLKNTLVEMKKDIDNNDK